MYRISIVFSVLLGVCLPTFAEDWPMLGHDPRRTGSTSEDVRFPTVRKWYRSFHDEGLSCGLQPVIANKIAYVGTMHGTMHAIDAATGKDKWTFVAGGGILASAAIADGACYFGSLDGKVYALDAATGQLKWTYQTGMGIWNAPLVIDGKVLIGGRDNYFYSIDAASGKLAWRSEVGGPILQSPAYDDGKVYVAAEDMKAYCFNAADGKILWTGQLYGVSCRSYHPVIAGEVVMFTTQPGLGKFGPVDVLLEACQKLDLQTRTRIGADPRGPAETAAQIKAKDDHDQPLLMQPEILKKQLENVREIQKQKPNTRSFFAFNKTTGQEPWIAPICWEESCGGPGNPPIVLNDGRVVVKYALFTWARHGEYARYIREGFLDLKTGDITSVMDPYDHSKGPPIGLVHDEMARLTGTAGGFIHARQGYGGFRGVVRLDLGTVKTEVLADNIHFGVDSIGPMTLLHLLKGEDTTPGLEYLSRGIGVFGGTGTYSAVSIADGQLYYIPGHEGRTEATLTVWATEAGARPVWHDPTSKSLIDESYRTPDNIALIRQQPLDWDMLIPPYGRCWPSGAQAIAPEEPEVTASRQAEAQQYALALPRQQLEAYIWDIPKPAASKAPAELRQRLNSEVQQLMSTAWAPLPFPDLMFGGQYYFDDPTEVFNTLAIAYPMLDGPVQEKVRAYLREQFAGQNPLAVDRLAPRAGERRTLYDLPSYADVKKWDSRLQGIRRLYPLWAWANATGDWEPLKAEWAGRIRPLLGKLTPPKDVAETLWQNDVISGLIAYARLARQFGDADAEKSAVELALTLFRGRIEAERTYTMTRFHQRLRNVSVPTRYMFMSPEVGRMIREHAMDSEKALYARYVEHHRPTWYLAWGPLIYDAWETSIDRPLNSWAVFSARAMLFNDDGATLGKYLDLPWCKADLFYIQKLALTAENYR